MFCEVMVLTAIQNGWQLPRIPLADMVQELMNDNFDTRLDVPFDVSSLHVQP